MKKLAILNFILVISNANAITSAQMKEKISYWNDKVSEAKSISTELDKLGSNIFTSKSLSIQNQETGNSIFPTKSFLGSYYYVEETRPARCPLKQASFQNLAINMYNLTGKLTGKCRDLQSERYADFIGGIESMEVPNQDEIDDAELAKIQGKVKQGSQVLGQVLGAAANKCRYAAKEIGFIPAVANSISDLSTLALIAPSNTGYALAAGGQVLGSVLKLINGLFQPKFKWNYPPDMDAFININCSFYDLRNEMKRRGVYTLTTEQTKKDYELYSAKVSRLDEVLKNLEEQAKTINEKIEEQKKSFLEAKIGKEAPLLASIQSFISTHLNTHIDDTNRLSFLVNVEKDFQEIRKALEPKYGDLESLSERKEISQVIEEVNRKNISRLIRIRKDINIVATETKKKLERSLILIFNKAAFSGLLDSNPKLEGELVSLEELVSSLKPADYSNRNLRSTMTLYKKISLIEKSLRKVASQVYEIQTDNRLIYLLATNMEALLPIINDDLYKMDLNSAEGLRLTLLSAFSAIKIDLESAGSEALKAFEAQTLEGQSITIEEAKKLAAESFNKMGSLVSEVRALYNSKVESLSSAVNRTPYSPTDDGAVNTVNLSRSKREIAKHIFGNEGESFLRHINDETKKLMKGFKRNYAKFIKKYKRYIDSSSGNYNARAFGCSDALKLQETFIEQGSNLELAFDWMYTNKDLLNEFGPNFRKLILLPTGRSDESYILHERKKMDLAASYLRTIQYLKKTKGNRSKATVMLKADGYRYVSQSEIMPMFNKRSRRSIGNLTLHHEGMRKDYYRNVQKFIKKAQCD